MRVLVVEDEAALAHAIADGLRDQGLAVDVALDGDAAVFKTQVNAYDVVVLDRDLPGTHGDDVCRVLVDAAYHGRILMLTAAADLRARVEGLDLGADDYLGKPFAFAELLARIRSLGRRRGSAGRPVITANGIVMDCNRRAVTRHGRPVTLTRKEFGVLEALLEADGRVVSAEELLERVWDEHADPFTTAVRVTLARVRAKLGDPPAIDTVIGVGYRIIP